MIREGIHMQHTLVLCAFTPLFLILGQVVPVVEVPAGTTGLGGINYNTVILGLLSLLTTAVSGVIAIFMVKAQASAALAAKAADAVAHKVEEVKNDLVQSTTATNGKLDVIHALSNSALTASMKSDELSQTLNVFMMEGMLKSNEKQGIAPSDEAMSALEQAKGRVEELRKVIAERERQQEIINQKIAEGQQAGPVEVRVTNKPHEAIPAEIVAKP